jgi:hypothetical protein
MLRCTAPFVIAAYAKVRLIPHVLCALPLDLFTKPYEIVNFTVFNEFIYSFTLSSSHLLMSPADFSHPFSSIGKWANCS